MIIVCMPCCNAQQTEIKQKPVLHDLIQHTRRKIHLLTNQVAVESLCPGNIPGISMWQTKLCLLLSRSIQTLSENCHKPDYYFFVVRNSTWEAMLRLTRKGNSHPSAYFNFNKVVSTIQTHLLPMLKHNTSYLCSKGKKNKCLRTYPITSFFLLGSPTLLQINFSGKGSKKPGIWSIVFKTESNPL